MNFRNWPLFWTCHGCSCAPSLVRFGARVMRRNHGYPLGEACDIALLCQVFVTAELVASGAYPLRWHTVCPCSIGSLLSLFFFLADV